MQSGDVDFKDLFEVIRKVCLFSDDSSEIQETDRLPKPESVHKGERVSLEWMLIGDLGELDKHALVRFVEPIVQSLEKHEREEEGQPEGSGTG